MPLFVELTSELTLESMTAVDLYSSLLYYAPIVTLLEINMVVRNAKSIEWSNLANHHVVVVTLESGERVVHTSVNLGYLKRVVKEKGYKVV